MALMTNAERPRAEALAELMYSNPFLPERIEREKCFLGDEFTASDEVWSIHGDSFSRNPNIEPLGHHALALVNTWRDRLAAGTAIDPDEIELYEDAVIYALFHRYRPQFSEVTRPDSDVIEAETWTGPYDDYRDDVHHYLGFRPLRDCATYRDPAHTFACLFQVRRAFDHTFNCLVGRSMPAARLRAAIWQSVFTHDMRRYKRCLYERMGQFPTLITGPSGTGKELVARAVAMSRYVPFDPARGRFVAEFSHSFHPLNLSALSPTLIESELFGHRRGAFTGAVEDRRGWLEVCDQYGSVFLDEVGELSGAIQVKLLRVLQTGTFQRLGDTESRRFSGKIIAATNRNLDEEMDTGNFRADFYYRLCADLIRTPSLAEQLRECPDDLANMVGFLARRAAGEDEAPALAAEVVAWIDRKLGRDYPWPGNVRELEQCVRNVMIRREYRPPDRQPHGPLAALQADLAAGSLTADQLLTAYCRHVYRQVGSYQEAARRLDLDRRTVKKKVEDDQ